jgi:hypothetical protein
MLGWLAIGPRDLKATTGRLGLLTAVAVVLAATLAGTAGASAAPSAVRPTVREPLARADSVAHAYQFLDQMMDLYASGSVPRLVQSFAGGVLAKKHFTDSVTYDDALMIDAYLLEGTPEGLSRAEIIGNGLLYVQANNPAHDGRIQPAYEPTPLSSTTDVTATERGTDVGNMTWVGQALVHLYEASAEPAYLHGAEAIGGWIQEHAYDTRGAGGYTGGLTAHGKRIKWKSAEHNIDLYSLFTLLAQATGEGEWSTHATWARRFVESMWEPLEGRFYVGSTTNGVSPEDGVMPEDVNSWSYLALEDPAYGSSLDWDATKLASSDGAFTGVSFCAGDRSGVWFEGTAHLADALALRDRLGDEARSETYLSGIERAQTGGLNNDGLGIIAASKNKLSDCEGEFYYASLHTGATAWYILAAERVDPFLAIG